MTHSALIPPEADHIPTQLTLVTLPQPSNANRRRVIWLTATLVALGLIFCATIGQGSKALRPDKTAPQPEVDGKRIVFPVEYAKRIALETVDISTKKVVPAFSVVGLATFDPAHVVRVGARLRGVVRDVYHYEGESVKAGEALAAIDSPELGQAQASVSVLAAENGVAERNRVREQALADRQLTTKRYLEEAVADADRSKALLSAAQQRVAALAGTPSTKSQRRLGVHVLTSPLTGTLIERRVAKGQLVEADHSAFLVANLDHLWVELLVFERHLAAIKVGDAVELHAENHGSPDIVRGKIAHLGVVLDADTRGATVRVYVDNKARKFRPGQSVNAVIRATAAAVDDIPTVPASAVVYVDGEPSVFIADGPTSVIVTKVELGETNGQEVQIKDGVETGQRVVTRGTTELRNQLFR